MSVLQRKAQAGKQEHQARSMTVPKSLRVSLAKVADDLFDMALAVIGVTQEKCAGDGLNAVIEPDSLLLLLDGPNGATGGVMIGAGLVGALVQQQTTGRVAPEPSVDRKMTVTDAALCAPLMDALFKRANAVLETEKDKDVLSCFRFGARAENARLFELAMGAAEYHVLRLTVDVASGAFQSPMVMILPVPDERHTSIHDPTDGQKEAPPSKPTLEKTVLGLQAEITAVLGRVKIPLAQISTLKPGVTLRLPSDAFDEVELVSVDGSVICTGAMGQIDGQRAICLNDAPAAYGETHRYDDLDASMPIELPDVNVAEPLSVSPPESFPDMSDAESSSIGELPDLPDIPDFPDFADQDEALEALDLPDLDDELPDLEDLPKLNIA